MMHRKSPLVLVGLVCFGMPCGLASRAKAKVLQLDYVGGANRASRGSESEAHFESSRVLGAVTALSFQTHVG